MNHIGPLNSLPLACTLTAAAGRTQLDRWQKFDGEYALKAERTNNRLTLHYAKLEDSISRLRELVAAESACCTFVDWNIDETQAELRLIVTGTSDQLAALNVGSAHRQPAPTGSGLIVAPDSPSSLDKLQ